MPSATNYLIVHGAFGSPQENWFPWLKTKLQQSGGTVFVPQFPTPDNQNLITWQKVASVTLKDCDPAHTVLIGHSTGAVFVLRMAEQARQPFKAVFSVCPFMEALGNPTFDPLNASFVTSPFNAVACKKGALKITCFAGDNDPYVPLASSKDVANKVGAELIMIAKGGHLNADAGYVEFPQLLDRVRTES